MIRPLVLGHRGAPAYRPENTLGSIALAIEQGVDGVEIDVVPTRDGVLVVRHDASLAATTDVASRAAFAGRGRDGDWWTTDLDADEIRALGAEERWPALRPASAAHDGDEGVPTLAEVLALTAAAGALLVIEVKAAAAFGALGLDPAPLLAAELADARALPPIVLESFEPEPLVALAGLGLPRMLLRERDQVGRIDAVALAADGWAGVSIPVEALDEILVERLHAAGLAVWAWTLRAEQRFLPPEATWHEHCSAVLSSGVDAVFADQPDLALRVVAELSGAAAPSPRAR